MKLPFKVLRRRIAYYLAPEVEMELNDYLDQIASLGRQVDSLNRQVSHAVRATNEGGAHVHETEKKLVLANNRIADCYQAIRRFAENGSYEARAWLAAENIRLQSPTERFLNS